MISTQFAAILGAMSEWHVLYLRPRCEKKMAEFCGARSIEHYLPLRKETKIYQRRKVTVYKPVFPGYFFVAFDRAGRLALLKTNNIVRILQPASQSQFLHELGQIRMALAVDPSLGASRAIERGRRVRITAGPFAGIEGQVGSVKGQTVVRLNVEMIGQAVAIEIEREYLEPAD